jgi:hypothetical protein
VIAAAGTAIRDHAVDDGVEPHPRHAGAAQFRHRQPFDHVGERQHHHPEGIHHAGQRFSDLDRLRFDVGVEQGLADDRQRQPVHLAGNVDRPPVDPGASHPIRVRHHRRAVGGNPVAVERRLHQPALPQMDRALAGQQSFAENPLGALQPAALHEALVVRDEDVLDVLRIVDEEHLLAAHAVGDDVAVGAREIGEEGERIAAGQIHERSEDRLFGAGDRNGDRHNQLVNE